MMEDYVKFDKNIYVEKRKLKPTDVLIIKSIDRLGKNMLILNQVNNDKSNVTLTDIKKAW